MNIDITDRNDMQNFLRGICMEFHGLGPLPNGTVNDSISDFCKRAIPEFDPSVDGKFRFSQGNSMTLSYVNAKGIKVLHAARCWASPPNLGSNSNIYVTSSITIPTGTVRALSTFGASHSTKQRAPYSQAAMAQWLQSYRESGQRGFVYFHLRYTKAIEYAIQNAELMQVPLPVPESLDI